MKKAKQCLTALLSGVLLAITVLSGCGQSQKAVSKNDDHLTVYLWENRLMKNIVPYINEQFPDQDIEFITCLLYTSGQSEEYLSELNQQLDDLQNRLQELQDQYDAKQNELVQIQADLEDAKAKEEEQYEAMKLRIQYMYENSSGNGYMAMLFSSKSISELISRAEYIQKISDFDRDLMQEYEDTVNQVKEKAVSYTHLDVYKRQGLNRLDSKG